jgi:hypothetical protein
MGRLANLLWYLNRGQCFDSTFATWKDLQMQIEKTYQRNMMKD